VVHVGCSSLIRVLATDQGLTALIGAGFRIVTPIAIILVAANLGAEWSQGTRRNLLVREPGRVRLLAGKMVALLLFVLLSAAVAMVVGAGVALVAAQSHGISTVPWTSSTGVSNYLTFVGNRLLTILGFSLLGMLIAVATRSAAAAVGVSLAYVLVVEGLVDAVWPEGAQWMPVHVFGYLTNTTPPNGYETTLVAALLYMAAFLVVAGAVFRMRDVSA
jgi:ABC-2 type transport system permease protein